MRIKSALGAWIQAAVVSAWMFSGMASHAGTASESNVDQDSASQETANPVWAEAEAAMQRGPQTIKLLGQAELALPEGYGFVPHAQAVKVMEAMGNETDARFVGLIFPTTGNQHWFVTVDYEAAGYIKDDDAKDWNADDLLKNLREGTEAGNEHRIKLGIDPIKVTRWVEKPTYVSAQHQLVWSAEARLRDKEDPDPGVNYNTYVLGREGYISMDLVTSLATVEQDKPSAKQLLAAVSFVPGKRYTDFNSSTDKVAAYGLAALVGGLAVKKLGLLAVIGAFLAKFAKLIFVAVAGGGAALRKWFKRKDDQGSEQA